MIYHEFQPNTLLTPYIETYWTAHGFQGPEEFHRILPDGCVDIIISLHPSVDLELKPFQPHIVGAMTTFCNSSYSSDVSLFGIRFRPTGFTAFCRVPIYEFTDQKINLVLVESLFDQQFYENLSEITTIAGVICHMDSYLVKKLSNLFAVEPRIVFAVNQIRQSKGQLALQEVAYKSCLSPRHFERKFKSAVGISPKMFSRIVRFQYACKYLKAKSGDGLLAAAADCGYYDQAHLIKDFKALSGNAPSDFRG